MTDDVEPLNSDEIAEQILKLRVAGSSPRDIARHFGLSIAETNRLLDKALGVVDDKLRSRAMLVDLELLGRLQQPFLRLAMAGDTQAAALVLKILERRACYLSLDSPVRVDVLQQVEVHQPNSTERIRAAINRLTGPQQA
jgi:hypothetical protein